MNDDLSWLNRKEYPFEHKNFKLPVGNMHYIDEGDGIPIVLVHGNSVWSFVYRKVIIALKKDFRCIASDHIGFGLSDKPQDWSYLPKAHATNFELFLNHLNLQNIILVINDWGGPIGISYALKYPNKIKGIVISNSWMWPVKDDFHFRSFSWFMGKSVGKYLIKYHNFFVKRVMPVAFGNKDYLSPEIHSQYLYPLNEAADRKGCYIFPREILGSSDWLNQLYKNAHLLQDKPTFIAWGLKDIAFRQKELKKWQTIFNHPKIEKLPDTGHYVCEEKPQVVIEGIKSLDQ